MKYINVVINHNSRHTDTYYTYAAPDDITVGDIVEVSFNRGNKPKNAYVFEEGVTPDCEVSKIKAITGKNPDISLNPEMVKTCIWMKRRYGIKYLDAVKCFVPNGNPAKEGKEKEPYKDAEGERQDIRRLTEEQQIAVDTISCAVRGERQESFLIHGVTGSGKTEVYMQVIAEVLAASKTAIMLVPEIALTKQIIDRFIARFGKKSIAVLHSKLTKRERFDEWQRIRAGKANIVIGARLGVFAPLENIGVIIMDEEHEATYKSDMTPKYDTVDIALKRLMYYQGVLILGSATPSVVSYQRAKEGIYRLITLKQRYNSAPLPTVELVDMREELREGNRTVFSDRLYRKMEETLAKGQQIILFLNRRGYSTFISCRECGEVMECPECGISLTYHKKENAGVCHYCGKKFSVPASCPKCGSKYIKYFGSGTEKVEEFTRELFPDRKVERLDLDTAKNSREINRIIGNFSKGKTEILIGTQLVAKGLDFKNVGLVGVVAADVSLHIPDYRSTERTFQLVTQVSGRAGRGEEEGHVIVQSYTPDNFALTTAANHDYEGFFQMEASIRQMMDYPPFSDLILVEFTSEKEEYAFETAESCRNYLIRCKLEEESSIFEAKPSYHFKGKDSFRYFILIKCPKGLRNKYIYCIDCFGENLKKNRDSCAMTIDVNPYSTI
ncbi:replication restart helicase PriA [Senimuribacter intestinalis]|uniref:replication restart helicase PriA n=1 Tax=Senimuribacter intestinalis TaxID=2941507 RepID=UPI002041B621|nr:primosomal protein N' [Senimuribacter intestinalis]